MPNPRLQYCRKIDFPIVHDHRGNLTHIENSKHIPFDIKRVYYIYDVPGGSERAAHAHRSLEQIYIAISGSFDVWLDDGHEQKMFHLNRSYYGLYICPMIWRRVDNFSSGSVLLALASDYYKEDEYIRDYETFLSAI